MAICKYCQSAITRLDKEVCPFCGGLKPLEGTDTTTQDVTKVIDQLGSEIELKQKKKIVAFVLAVILGIFGIDELYLGKKKPFIIELIISVIFITSIGLVLFFLTSLSNALAFLIPYFVLEIYHILKGVRYFTKNDLVDGNGEFLI